jgi:hypothetical protein
VQGLTDIARRSRVGTAVVVSHDAVNRQLLAAFDGGLGIPARSRKTTGASTRSSCEAAAGRPSASTSCLPRRRESPSRLPPTGSSAEDPRIICVPGGEAGFVPRASGLIRKCLARRR